LEDESSVPAKPDIVSHLLALPHESLIDQVRQLVKQRHAAHDAWANIRTNTVLAARVRGVLSGLDAEARGTSDEVMRLMWIKQARQALDQPARAETNSDQASDKAPATQPEEAPPTFAQQEQLSLSTIPAHQPRPPSTAPGLVFRSPGL
jgi:hypothetical protein